MPYRAADPPPASRPQRDVPAAVALVASAVVWLALLVSVALFSRLPPAGPRLGELGWPEDDWPNGSRAILDVMLQPSGDAAWIVFESHATRREYLCLVALASGRASRCEELGPRSKQIARHRGSDGWRLVLQRDDDNAPLVLVQVPDVGPILQTKIELPERTPRHSTLVHLTELEGQPVVWLGAKDGASLVALQITVDPRTGRTHVERFPMPEEQRLQRLLAVRGHQSPTFTAEGPSRELIEVTSEATTALASHCQPFSACVRNSSTLDRRDAYRGGLVAVFGPDGTEYAAADLWPPSAEDISFAHLADGRIHPWWQSRSASGNRVAHLRAQDKVWTITSEIAGLEWLLVAHRGEAERHAIARRVAPVPDVVPIPFDGGREGWLLIATDARSQAYAVPVDADLRPRTSVPWARRVTAIIRERGEYDPIAIALYLFGVAFGLPLLITGAWYALRGARRRRRFVLVAASVVYVLLVGGLLLAKGSYLFPQLPP